MLEFFGLLFLACLLIWFFPFLLAALVAVACLILAACCWVKELFTPSGTKSK